MHNPLLKRKQMVIDVKHPTSASVSKANLRTRVQKDFKVSDDKCVALFGFRTQFGGGLSTGFCLVYENLESVKKFEPRYRQVRLGMMQAKMGSAKAKKEKKNKMKKLRAKAKREAQS